MGKAGSDLVYDDWVVSASADWGAAACPFQESSHLVLPRVSDPRLVSELVMYDGALLDRHRTMPVIATFAICSTFHGRLRARWYKFFPPLCRGGR